MEHRRKKITKKRFKGLDKPPTTVHPPCSTPMSGITPFSETSGSVSAHSTDVSASPTGAMRQHLALIRHGASIGDAKLWYDQAKKPFYLLVSLAIDVLNQPASTSTRSSAWMSAFAIWQ